MLLKTLDLSKCYGEFHALNSLNMHISPGEVYGLLGPNGAGKSTALRLIMGFLKPSSGKAMIAEHDCWTDGVAARKKIAYLPGELRLYENMSGRQLVNFLSGLRDRPVRPDLDKMARIFDINIDTPMANMSSGMKRKVALLLVLDPYAELIIMDEPTNTLDPTMREALLDEVKAAKKRGQAVFFSSHVLSEVETVCDRVGVLRKGRLVHQQSMDELTSGRRIRLRLARESSVPDLPGLQLIRKEDTLFHLEHNGALEPLMAWIGKLELLELGMEPLGLENIYRKIHGDDA
ncbi:ABC transporter ATP-binding protein [bacterium]|jgi:ABC-2 type transport system ATP-binding protein|nr:ABC transporter ATP-binding protein [bacterium]